MSKGWRLIWLIGLLWLIAVACRAPEPALLASTAQPTLTIATIATSGTASATRPVLPATTGQPQTPLSAPPTRTPTVIAAPVAPNAPTPTPYPFAPPDPALPTPLAPIPTPVTPLPDSADTINIILLGNDGPYLRGGRTDTLIILSVNTRAQTAALLSLPRDLYVYIPGWTMERINLATPHGWGVNYPQGGGQLIKDTILYNTGISIDYFIRIGFDGFKRVIDTLKGVDVAVICPLTDWRLTASDLDPAVAENWEQFTLESGVQRLDGDLALWYVRSRITTNDFERGRRQQQVLSAILERGVSRDLLSRIPELWEIFQDEVETDLDLPTVIKLATLAPAIRANGIRHVWLDEDAVSDLFLGGKWLQVLNWEAAEPVFHSLLGAPILGHGARGALTVEVITNNVVQYRLAAENLAWQGFSPTQVPANDLHNETGLYPTTSIVYYGPNLKGAYAWLLSWVFHDIPVTLDPRSGAVYDYAVRLGQDFNPCRSPLTAPTQPPSP